MRKLLPVLFLSLASSSAIAVTCPTVINHKISNSGSLAYRDLRGCSFSGVHLTGNDFTGANLTNANFSYTTGDLKAPYSVLTGANFGFSDLGVVNINAAQSTALKLSDSFVFDLRASNADLYKLNLRNSTVHVLTAVKSKINGLDETNAMVAKQFFNNSVGAVIANNSVIPYTVAKNANLNGSRFNGAHVECSNFDGSLLDKASFAHAGIYGIDFNKVLSKKGINFIDVNLNKFRTC